MRALPCRVTTLIFAIGLFGLVAGSSVAAPVGPTAAGLTLTYSVAEGAVNNSVHLGPSLLMASPRVVSGPYYANLSLEAVYVLGINNSGPSSCHNLTVFRSNNSGLAFSGPYSPNLCLSGSFVDAVVLSNGTIVLVAPGPVVALSYDGAAHWTTPRTLGAATGPPTLTEDPVSGTLYLSWTPSSPGPIYVAASTDGGANWSALPPALSTGVEGTYPEIAAIGGHLVLTYLSASNGTTGDSVESVDSADGGLAWSAPTVLEPAPTGAFLSAPTVAASAQDKFAATWYESNGNLTGGRVLSAVSSTNGTSWNSPFQVGASAPPQYSPQYFPQIAAFDSQGRLFVVWHNYSANTPLEATLNVAVSDRSLSQFNTSSFSLQFETSAPNGTQYENLGAGPLGQVFLAWDVYGSYSNPVYGIFARSVTGAVAGSISGGTPGMQLLINSAATNATVSAVRWTGAAVTLQSLPPDVYQVWVRSASGTALAGSMPVLPWSETNFTVRVSALLTTPPMPSGPPWLVIAGVGGLLAPGGLLAAVLYTRISPETVLQQKVRLLVYEYVSEHRGASFSQVRDAVGLRNGAAAYHLGVLERQGLILSVHQGRRRLFTAVGVPSIRGGVLVSELQRSIVEAVRSNPGIGVREISRSVGKVPSSVSYNVRALSRRGLLRTEWHGARLRCFPAGTGGS